MTQTNSRLFSGYRALGINSDQAPCVIRYNQKHQETYVITSVGKAFHVYKCSNLGLVRVSDLLEHEISCLGVDANYIYAASEKNIFAFIFGRKVVKTFKGHEAKITQILPFANHLISVDACNVVKLFEIDTAEVYLSLNFPKGTFDVTCMVHPVSYLNKILFASQQGTMQLWNMKTSKLVYTYKSFNSAITCLKQAPAIDVCGIGLEDGRIILHNLKYDETLMTFLQEWGAVKSLTFRTDGNPIMISGGHSGHMAIWNLEEKRLVSQLREAHSSSVDGMQSLQLEPLMVTSSGDNSIKIWIFDMSDGSARLLRQRHGHSMPPNKIKFHGQTGETILSAGLDSYLMSFSSVHDSKNKSLGRGSYNKVETKRTGLKLDTQMMPPIIDFCSNEVKESEWDSIICVHDNLRMATTWNYIKSTMGKYKLENPRFKENEKFYRNVTATSCTVSACGNFCLIGYSSGHVDLYNIQSGLFRGSYGEQKAHESSVRSVQTDALNLTTITCSENGEILFWPFKEKKNLISKVLKPKFKLKLENDATINHSVLHRESGMLAVSTDDFSVFVIDCDVKRVVRQFNCHTNKISDMAFSPDARWLITASMDCLVKVWDLPSGKLIDCFKFENAPTSVCFSPTAEFLATTHVNDLGIFLWSNKSLYSHVSLKQLPNDYEPENVIQMPNTNTHVAETSGGEAKEENMDENDLNDYKNYVSPEQLGFELITLSMLPESRWKNLVYLDIIKQRNKPKEAPKVPKLAPFFLPTVANETGFTFKNAIDANNNKTELRKNSTVNLFLSDFASTLSKSSKPEDYVSLLSDLKTMGPSAIDIEVRSLSEEMGGSVELIGKFLELILHTLTTKNNFELANAYLALVLNIHGDKISQEDQLIHILEQIKEIQSLAWSNLKLRINKSVCLVGYLKSVT